MINEVIRVNSTTVADNFMLIMGSIFIFASITISVVLCLLQNRKKKKYKKMIDKLEVEKNQLDTSPIAPELDKMDYKSSMCKIAKLEMEIYKVRSNSEILLEEIMDVTNSEEKNRTLITNLKSEYRDLYNKYNSSINDFGSAAKYVGLQFENISKRFEVFENLMDNNDYLELGNVIKAIEEMLEHMKTVLDEVPPIVLLAENILPKRISELKKTYTDMLNDHYPLDYLNIDYNIVEANNKINDVVDRLKVLNLEDSLFELKVLMEYFDGVFVDLDKEKANRQTYEEMNKKLKRKSTDVNNLVNQIFNQLDSLIATYNLSANDVKILNDTKNELEVLNTDYKVLVTHTSNHAFAYSKLIQEIDDLYTRFDNLQTKLESSLEAIGSVREDESRTYQQQDEIIAILKDSKYKIRDYDFPVIPKSYYVETKEASEALKELKKELSRKPIAIETLNTRVDTARDLALKLYAKTKDMVKNAMLAETAIVYGNRYRPLSVDLDRTLMAAEVLFNKGDYLKSLEVSINALNQIDHGVYDKLVSTYNEYKGH